MLTSALVNTGQYGSPHLLACLDRRHFIIAQLEELGIVEVRQDPDDGRATIVEITASHSGVSDSYGLLMRSIEDYLADKFGAEDFETFRRIACSDWGEATLVPLVRD